MGRTLEQDGKQSQTREDGKGSRRLLARAADRAKHLGAVAAIALPLLAGSDSSGGYDNSQIGPSSNPNILPLPTPISRIAVQTTDSNETSTPGEIYGPKEAIIFGDPTAFMDSEYDTDSILTEIVYQTKTLQDKQRQQRLSENEIESLNRFNELLPLLPAISRKLKTNDRLVFYRDRQFGSVTLHQMETVTTLDKDDKRLFIFATQSADRENGGAHTSFLELTMLSKNNNEALYFYIASPGPISELYKTAHLRDDDKTEWDDPDAAFFPDFDSGLRSYPAMSDVSPKEFGSYILQIKDVLDNGSVPLKFQQQYGLYHRR